MKHRSTKSDAHKLVALALIGFVGALVISRLLIALKVVLGLPLLVITLWALFIPLKLSAFLMARAWWNGRPRAARAR